MSVISSIHRRSRSRSIINCRLNPPIRYPSPGADPRSRRRPPSRPCPATVAQVQPTPPRRPGPLRISAVCRYIQYGARGMDSVRSPHLLERTLGAAQTCHPLHVGLRQPCVATHSSWMQHGKGPHSGLGYRPSLSVQQPPTASHPGDRLPRTGELRLLCIQMSPWKSCVRARTEACHDCRGEASIPVKTSGVPVRLNSLVAGPWFFIPRLDGCAKSPSPCSPGREPQV
ncbi:hypothetical protein B0J15DRAFT_257515 [Fusarium solani]|uniref:Uncharacterized protein n=1 Tax=Fusarium solani TaxID=169388 RepID=A0A9P9HTT6_FUSSL|nr:uncharacterized protein B0J15DRAFT_257515 [Fusarium solani]KAH7263898.1 hypothetical protein B0J15DRAFT_257515 [Fusarium solani]